MKNKRLSIALFTLLFGIILTLGCIESAILCLSGKKLDLNSAPMSDFTDKARIEGEVFFPVDYFATYEESQTFLGFPAGKKETYYYLVANFDEAAARGYVENGVDFDEFYVVLSTADEKLIRELNALTDKWVRYYEDLDLGIVPEYPQGIQISGRLAQQPEDRDYIEYRDEFLEISGFVPSEVAQMRIIEGKVSPLNIVGAFAGIVLIVLGIVLIVLTVKRQRSEKENGFTEDEAPEDEVPEE